MMLKKDSYNSFEEWMSDKERVERSPNDKKLIESVARKTRNSSVAVQRQIKAYLLDVTFADDPMQILTQIARQHPEFAVICKTKEDPWFSA